jgi:lipopolysaccharide biosynthesis regulator YciM
MKIRTFIGLVLGFGVVALVGLTAYRNAELLNSPFRLGGERVLPLWGILVGVFFAGMFSILLLGLIREIQVITDSLRRRREAKRMSALEERFYEGLQSVMDGREQDALRWFRAVLESDPAHFNALLKLGEVLCAMGRYAEGIEYHRRAQNLRPDDTRPLYALAADYEAQGDLDKARSHLARIIEIKPKAGLTAYRRVRDIDMREGAWAQALESHNKIERLLHKRGVRDENEKKVGLGIRYSLGIKNQNEGKSKVAINLYRRLIKESPLFIPAYIRLGAALRDAGDDREAVDVWNRGFEITGSPIFLTVLEEHFLDKDQPMEAIEALKHCVAIAKKDTLPRFFLGKLYFRLEMLDESLEVLSALQGRTSYAPTLHYLIGRIQDRRQNYRAASEQYRNVIKELELVKLEYRCLSCTATLSDWTDRCPKCENWNTVEIDFREDISFQDLGVATAPVYSNLT